MSDANETGSAMADLRIEHGNPTAAEVAALVVALTPAGGDPAAEGTTGPTLPSWTHAALLEGVGGPTVYAPADLPARGGPHAGS